METNNRQSEIQSRIEYLSSIQGLSTSHVSERPLMEIAYQLSIIASKMPDKESSPAEPSQLLPFDYVNRIDDLECRIADALEILMSKNQSSMNVSAAITVLKR